jgi:PAS domain S-box-containing protein
MLDNLGSQVQVQRPVVGMDLWVGRVGLFIAVGIAYFLAAQLGLALLARAERVAVFWPAAGVAVGILVALGAGARGPVAAGVITATLAANLMVDRSVWSALAFALFNAGEALLATWLIERWFGPAFDLASLRRVLGFFAAAAVATATAAAAASGAMTLFGPSTAAFLDVWQIWFASDALGIITVAPVLIGVATAVRDAPSWREALEGTLAAVAVTASIGFLLVLLSGPWSAIGPGPFLFPLLLWLGYRCRPVFAAAAVFTIATALVWTTTYELGRYGDPTQSITIRIIAAQTAMLGVTLTALALSALFAERRRHEATIVASEARLRSILDAANVIAWDVDLTRDTVHSAGPVARLLNRPQAMTPGSFAAMVDTVHPEDRERAMAQFWTAVSTGAAYRLEFRLNSDSLRWVTAEGSIERDAHDRPVRVRGITQDITERKKADEELRKSESETRELLRALAERNTQFALAEKSALVGSFAYDVGADTLRISDGYAAIHGLPNETKEIARSRWLAGVHPEDRARVDEVRSRAFRTQSTEYTADFRIVRAGGEVRWIEGRAFVAFRDDGSPQRVAGVNIDVTARKRAEAALEESRARYRALYDDNPSMYFTVDAVGTVLSVNEFGAQQLGYTPAELVGQSVLEMVHKGDREEARRWLAACAENAGTIATTEMRNVRRDGSTMWVRTMARAVQGLGGQALVIVCENITERKKAEVTLVERNIQLALAGKAALVGSYAYDTDTEIMQISEGYAAIHGLPDGTTQTGRSECLAGVHPDDLGRVEQLRSDAFHACRREYSVEYRIIRPGGEMRWVETRCFVTYDSAGCPHRVVGVSIDITERKRVEEQQRKLVAELDHRAKNVLATVQAVATQTMQASSSMEHFVTALEGRIRSMGSTHELLSLRRWLGIPLADLVDRELAPYMTGSNTEIGGPEVMLSAEAGQTMAMVLHELVTNAAKYGALSDPAGRVSIRWRLPPAGNASDRLVITWRETRGPLVVTPSKSGYGIDVVRSVIPYELGGTVDHVFAPEGVRCQMEIPLAELSDRKTIDLDPRSHPSTTTTLGGRRTQAS